MDSQSEELLATTYLGPVQAEDGESHSPMDSGKPWRNSVCVRACGAPRWLHSLAGVARVDVVRER